LEKPRIVQSPSALPMSGRGVEEAEDPRILPRTNFIAAELRRVRSGNHRVRNFGMFVELTDTLTYGLVHISTLDDDFYTFDDVRKRFRWQTDSYGLPCR